MSNQPPSPFELATNELRALGITIARLPGEYRVNYRNGAEATARIAETLDEALALGRDLAAAAPATASPTAWKAPPALTADDTESRQ